MAIFSKTCEYALRAVFYIANKSQQNQKTGIREISDNIGSPEYFLAKVLQRLVKHGIILSVKGPKGGFYMNDTCLGRSLADVISVIDGKELFSECGVGLEQCTDEHPCPLHDEYVMLRTQMNTLFRGASISEYAARLKDTKFTLGVLSEQVKTSL